jgi:hypothetical protein
LLLKYEEKYALNGATGIFLYSFTPNGMFFVENLRFLLLRNKEKFVLNGAPVIFLYSFMEEYVLTLFKKSIIGQLWCRSKCAVGQNRRMWKIPSVKIAVGQKFHRSKWPSVKIAVCHKIAVVQNFRRSKLLSVKISVGQNCRRSKWPSVKITVGQSCVGQKTWNHQNDILPKVHLNVSFFSKNGLLTER